MSQAASQWAVFARDVAAREKVWTIRDRGGFPPPLTASGKRAHPFWSSLERVEAIIRTVPAYSGFEPFEISWQKFRDAWLPGMERDGLLVGVNWSGPRALGYDIDPPEVLERIEFELSQLDSKNA